MKTKNITFGIATIIVASSLTFTSCRKKDKTPAAEPDTEQGTASDNNLAENSANDVLSMGSQLSESGSLTTFKTSQNDLMFASVCASITANNGGTLIPTSYTLDFGTTGCIGSDGRTRTGKLIYDFSLSANGAKYYRNPGFKMTVTSNNYVVDGNQIAITKTVTNTSPVSITETSFSSNLTWQINANVSIVKANAGGTISWTCSRTKELTNSSSTTCYHGQQIPITWTQAIIKLNGSASGTNAKGESFTSTSTNLIRSFVCAPNANQPHRHPFIGGQISYTPGNRPNRVIDFGNGTDCDFNATITINGQTYAFSLQ